ncbi:MAG: hypothetical protein LAO78_01085 [Acidobacteriia bacterium]|nr:hypothetical protein [Terriglobia bacterium]
MAVHKAIRSNSLAQPARRRPNLQPNGLESKDFQATDLQLKDPRPKEPQLKSELFEAIRHLNRGLGVALSSLDSLQRKDRLQAPGIFPRDLLLSCRNRTEALRAQINRDLLHLIAGHEEQEAERFSQLCGQPAESSSNPRRNRCS